MCSVLAEMNFLGSIGNIMNNTGLSELLESVYAPAAVVHMLSGKEISRAIRGPVRFWPNESLKACMRFFRVFTALFSPSSVTEILPPRSLSITCNNSVTSSGILTPCGRNIIQNEPDDSALKSIVLRLCGFHTEMSFLGSIGSIMNNTSAKRHR
jgi:hypothetical protein